MVIGRGNSAEVSRKTFDTPEGERSYAYKEVASLQEAQRSHQIYTELSEAGLPVAGFMKIITAKRDGEPVYALAMEDASEGGKYRLFQVNMVSDGYNNTQVKDAIARCADPEQLAKRMTGALATMHNLGIYDSHPGLSFFLKQDVANSSMVDFVILDYSNLSRESDVGNDRFERECSSDLRVLVTSLEDLPEAMSNDAVKQYHQIRTKAS